ncbi:HD domain-containing protein [Telmatobacter sp. DSM 110680]|uniref:5'-deoxynucleotidase n=1 Tax=Telmatobacter sp. DSM 110680 TaxID=3036704 RepID=A0AAU7DSH8_9BACT
MSREESLQPFIDFIRELDKLKGVERKTRPLGLARFENSAEHSWQLAVFALSLASFAPSSVNLQRVISMLLLHDIGEIDTGDMIVYATEGLEQRKLAEERAVKRICTMLPANLSSSFQELWHEFEAAETPEAKFAHAMDRSIPIILNLANNGQSWRENGIRCEQVIARNGPPVETGCPALWAYLRQKLDEAQSAGWFGAKEKKEG